MAKKDVLNFAPGGEKKKRNIPVLTGLIVAACLVLFGASVFTILAMNDFDIGKALGAREAEAEEDTTEQESYEDTTGEEKTAEAINFLVLCSDDTRLTFCQLISVDTENNEIKIKPLSSDYALETPDGRLTLNEMFGMVSYPELCGYFSSRGIKVSKYVHITEDSFKRIMSNLGQVPVTINGYYEFNVDAVKYTFSPGVEEMTSDRLLKYMKYAATGEDILHLQGHAAADIFRQHFTSENFEKGESFFSKLINFVDSDINAFDYNSAKSIIENMTSSETVISVVS